VKSALKGFVEAIYFIYAKPRRKHNVFAEYLRTSDSVVLEDSYNGYIKSIPRGPTRL
jgi:hypothetical protein